MSKQFITEAQRMQKLAGMPISEMSLPEMARTAGTGGAITITDKGEEILKQAKASGAVPEGIRANEFEVLFFLYKAKKDGKRVQKMDFANEKNVLQPSVNPIFNSLEAKELVAKEGYTSKQQEPKSSRPRPDISSMLGDLDIEEDQKKSLSEGTIDQVVKLFNDLSLSAEGDEEEGTFDSELDDKLQDLGLKFKFRGSDYINKKDLAHLGKDELQTLMQMLSKLKGQKKP